MTDTVPAVAEIIDATDLERTRVWRQCLRRLEASMSKPTFCAWVLGTRLVSLTGSVAVIATPTPTGREWLTSRHRLDLERALTEETGGTCTVEIVVDETLVAAEAAYESPPTLVEVEFIRPPAEDGVPKGRGRIENNLSRKAVFALQGRRLEGGGRETVTDVVGKVTRTYTLGQLGALEMDICTWLLGQWQPGNGGVVFFRLRELARGLGTKWNGDFGMAAKQAIRRMKETTITGKVYDAQTRRYREHGFSLIDEYVLDEQRDAMDQEGSRFPGTLRVRLGSWLVGQLEAGQFADLEMGVYRSGFLRAPKARRLYQYLECEEGDDDGTLVRIAVTPALGETLGTSDASRNPSRFRSDLVAYGRSICEATGGVYRSVELRMGTHGYELVVRRTHDWRRRREAGRQRFRALHPRAV